VTVIEFANQNRGWLVWHQAGVGLFSVVTVKHLDPSIFPIIQVFGRPGLPPTIVFCLPSWLRHVLKVWIFFWHGPLWENYGNQGSALEEFQRKAVGKRKPTVGLGDRPAFTGMPEKEISRITRVEHESREPQGTHLWQVHVPAVIALQGSGENNAGECRESKIWVHNKETILHSESRCLHSMFILSTQRSCSLLRFLFFSPKNEFKPLFNFEEGKVPKWEGVFEFKN